MANSPHSNRQFRFAIDRGGTFTDVYAECPGGELRVMKLLSVDPAYPDAPREGIRRILEQVMCGEDKFQRESFIQIPRFISPQIGFW